MKNSIQSIILMATSCLLLGVNQVSGYDKAVVDKPIVLQGIVKYDQVKYQQQEYIREHYEEYKVYGISNDLPKGKDGRFIQTFYLTNDEGDEVQVSFDITDAYKARKHKGNSELKKLVEAKEKAREKAEKEGSKFDQLTKADMKEIEKSVNELVAEELKRLGKTFEELPKEEKERIAQLASKLINELANKKLETKTSGK